MPVPAPHKPRGNLDTRRPVTAFGSPSCPLQQPPRNQLRRLMATPNAREVRRAFGSHRYRSSRAAYLAAAAHPTGSLSRWRIVAVVIPHRTVRHRTEWTACATVVFYFVKLSSPV